MNRHLIKTRERETEELLKALSEDYIYNPDTGLVTFRSSRRGGNYKGRVAGYLESDGYLRMTYKGERYMLHRVAWALYYGVWPKNTIDHINRDKSDNRITNLRDVPQHVNNQNKRPYKKRR